MNSWYWPMRWSALQHGIEHADRRVVDPVPYDALDHPGKRPGEDDNGQYYPSPPEGALQEEADPGAERHGQYHAEQRVPPRVLEAGAQLSVIEDAFEIAEAHKVVGRRQRVVMDEGFDSRQHRGVDGQGADEHHQGRDHEVRQGTIAPGPSLGAADPRAAPPPGAYPASARLWFLAFTALALSRLAHPIC